MSNNAATSHTIPITLIGGYLGAGKTTLINKLLSYPGLPPGVAVLVNDFGDVNIDESLIRSESDDGTVIGLSNGCICCSISDDLSKALDELRELAVQRVIMETSGVAEPARVWRHCHYPGFTPVACVVLVDASNHAARSQDKYVGNLVRAQAAQAHLHVVSKTDLNPDFELHHLTPQLSSQDPDLIDTVLRWHYADDATFNDHFLTTQPSFRAHTWHQEETIARTSLETLLNNLSESVQRVKGWVDTFEGIYLVSKVGSRAAMIELRENQPPTAMLGLVIITYGDAGSILESIEHAGASTSGQITMTLSS
ncbi:MAG: GTP-binding protein [Pseudomonadota bacterium]|nr:GTP-binding protein [Pseudomonadota bacterium]